MRYPFKLRSKDNQKGVVITDIESLRTFAKKHTSCSNGFISMAHKIDLVRILEIQGFRLEPG